MYGVTRQTKNQEEHGGLTQEFLKKKNTKFFLYNALWMVIIGMTFKKFNVWTIIHGKLKFQFSVCKETMNKDFEFTVL